MSPAKKKPRLLVSGGTGFLGTQVVPLLREFAEVTCISRSQPGCLIADLTEWDAGLDAKALKGKFDAFLHMGGRYNLRMGLLEALRHNVGGTNTALTLAQKAGIPRFIHISSFAVTAGRGHDFARPDRLDTSQGFPDHYSASKAYGEELVRAREGEWKLKLVLRPGILVGDSREGKIARIDGPYHCPEGLTKIQSWLERYNGPIFLPGRAERTIPVVPVDAGARAIARLCLMAFEESWDGTRSLHLSPSQGLSPKTLYESTLRELGLNPSRLQLVHRLPKGLLKGVAEAFAELPREELEYLLSTPALECDETDELLGADWCPPFESYEKAFWKGYHEYVSNR